MGATFPRLKDWVSETLTAADLNAEIDNILNNLDPSGVGDHSTNIAQMQAVTNPYPSGAASLANSLAGEIERLRYQIKLILGDDADYWYEVPSVDLSILSEFAFGSGLPRSRVVSAPTTSSELPLALDPAGSTNELTILQGINYYIDGTEYNLTADYTITGLASAPTTNQTCLVNDTTAADGHATTYAGEYDTYIPIDTIGSEITSVINTLQSWKINNGSETEYFLAYFMNDPVTGNQLKKAQRGMFFDSTGAPKQRIAFSNNDTITLCKTAWVFLDANGGASVTYFAPVWSYDAPTSPNIGDFWYDLTLTTWKSYSPGGWAASDSVLIGYAVMDGANCVAARTVDTFKAYSELNSCNLEAVDTTTVRIKTYGGRVSVYGQTFNLGYKGREISTASDILGGSVAANTNYYIYMTEEGDIFFGTYAPHDRRGDLGGYYYPTESWRCLGYCRTNGSSLIVASSVVSFTGTTVPYVIQNRTITATTTITDFLAETYLVSGASGAYTITLPTAVGAEGKTLRFIKTETSANLVTIDGAGSETIGGYANMKLYSINDHIEIVSDGANWQLRNSAIKVFFNAVGVNPTGTINTTPNIAVFGTDSSDSHGAYNNGTGVFTAPYSGIYTVSLKFGFTAASAAVGNYYAAAIYRGGVEIVEVFHSIEVINRVNATPFASCSIYVAEGDTIAAYGRSSTTTPSYAGGLGASALTITAVI